MRAIRWLGQAGFIVETDQARVGVDLFLRDDPRLRKPFQHPDQIGRVDAAFVTHEHHDHLDGYTLLTLQERLPDMTVVVPEPVRQDAENLGLRRVAGARPGQSVMVGDIDVTPVRALHAVHMEEGYHFGEPDGRFLGYVLRTGGAAVYHSGDTIMYPEMADTLKALGVTVMLLPINGRSYRRERADLVGNLLPDEAVDLARDAGARALIPMHYETYPNNLGDVGQAADLAYRGGVTFIVPHYGQPVPLDWLADESAQAVFNTRPQAH